MTEQFKKHPLSAIGTRIKINQLEKTISKYVAHESCSLEKAFICYEKYLKDWSEFNYLVKSKIYKSDHFIEIKQELKGSNILEKKLNLDLIKDYIDQIICLFEYANENRLYADPHLKNFTLKDNILNYVDISPPYSEIYNEFVIEKATNDIDKFLIEKNLMFFRWDWLPFHFSADLISIDLDAITWMDDLYQMLKKSFSTNIDKDNFKQRVIMVRFYEDKRIAKGLNLL